MAHPSKRRRGGGRHRATVMCALLAVIFVLGGLYGAPVRAQQEARGLAELESGSLPLADENFGHGHNLYKVVGKDGILDDKGLQTRSDEEAINMETVASSGATSSIWRAEGNPSIESGSSSSAAASDAGTAERSTSFRSEAGAASQNPDSSSARSSRPLTASSSSETSKEDQPVDGSPGTTLTNTTTTATTETPTTKRPAVDHGMGTSVVLFFFLLFIVAFIIYGGRLCPSACPFVGQNSGGHSSGPHAFIQQQHPRYTTLHGDDEAYRGMKLSNAAAGVPVGGRNPRRFYQSQRGAGDSEGHCDIFVELKDKPTKTVRSAGAHISGEATDSFSFMVGNNPAAKNGLVGTSASSAGPVTVQVPMQPKSSLKSLRKGKLGHVSTTPAASFSSGSTTETPGSNARSPLYRSTADTRSGHAEAAAMPPTTSQPRVEDDWGW
ncbi:hypothetical protein LINJ_33_2980 [Leishmania infantum JPCM5]|uniref:Uncharacterized protein n=2 Tax=Leishmania infantum TaxID=5671 RepID=E9AHS1_LEIIN|nr:hypothetical protein LINJ_33_2980 [Leishmania infantum JPCM5]CAC9534353.1 hypothetical_protein_-_conserved [Leishmania infantum]CBZ08971.1 hypothetical protein LINJ_33_2980 [Leishmania infantum JPCM5]SUZ45309.1 hypothetical_protein_-_conserved [Leishmania infantum]|eukprot:XP_003392772.1 hypothetical protein LINJ_33_2980 [Leishmania infantum JPCM5]